MAKLKQPPLSADALNCVSTQRHLNSVTEGDDDEFPADRPWPPAWFLRLVAVVASVLIPVWLFVYWGPSENRPEEAGQRLAVAGLLFLGALLSIWLADTWSRQGHLMHASGAFVVTVCLLGAGVVAWAP